MTADIVQELGEGCENMNDDVLKLTESSGDGPTHYGEFLFAESVDDASGDTPNRTTSR